MSDIKFFCPKCQIHIACDESYVGTPVECPGCNVKLKVPSPIARKGSPRAATPPPPERCPDCDSTLGVGAVLCTNCGYNLETGTSWSGNKPSTKGRAGRKKRNSRFTVEWLIDSVLMPACLLGLLPGLYFLLFGDHPPDQSTAKATLGVSLVGLGNVTSWITLVILTLLAFRTSISWGGGMLFASGTALFSHVAGSNLFAAFENPDGLGKAVVTMLGAAALSFLGLIFKLIFVIRHWPTTKDYFLFHVGAFVMVFLGVFWVPEGPSTESFGRSVEMAVNEASEKNGRISCYYNLAQIGLGFRIYANDNDGNYPMTVPNEQGGSREFARPGPDGTDGNAYRHFLVMSNELSVPRVLICPSDSGKTRAANWTSLGEANVSYILRSGPNVSKDNPDAILAQCPIHGHTVYCSGEVSGTK